MIKVSGIKLPVSYTDEELCRAVARKLKIAARNITTCRLYKRSVDARRKDAITFQITAAVSVVGDEASFLHLPDVAPPP